MQRLAIIGIVAAAALGTAVLTATAATNARTVKGPATVRGEGMLRAELTRTSGTRAVTLRSDGDGLYVLPLEGKVTVTCTGGSKRESVSGGSLPDTGSRPPVLCKGTTAGASIKGAGFRIFMRAESYTLVVPKGFTATLTERSGGNQSPPGGG
jgi:hypothetical protein